MPESKCNTHVGSGTIVVLYNSYHTQTTLYVYHQTLPLELMVLKRLQHRLK